LLGFWLGRIIRPKRAKRIASRMVDFPLSFSPVISEIPSEKGSGWENFNFLKLWA
jgi:hypothetical protein